MLPKRHEMENKTSVKIFFAIFCIFFPRNHWHSKTRSYLSRLLLDYTYTHKHVSEGKEM